MEEVKIIKEKGSIIRNVLGAIIDGKNVQVKAFQDGDYLKFEILGVDSAKVKQDIIRYKDRIFTKTGLIENRNFILIGSDELKFEKYHGQTCGVSEIELYTISSQDPINDLIDFLSLDPFKIHNMIKDSLTKAILKKDKLKFECRFGIPLFIKTDEFKDKTFKKMDLLNSLESKKGVKCQFTPQSLGLIYENVKKNGKKFKECIEVNLMIKALDKSGDGRKIVVVYLPETKKIKKIYSQKGKDSVYDIIVCGKINSLRLSLDKFINLDLEDYIGLEEFVTSIDFKDQGRKFPIVKEHCDYKLELMRYKSVVKYDFGDYILTIQNVFFDEYNQKIQERNEIEIYSKSLNHLLRNPNKRNEDDICKEFNDKFPKIWKVCEDLVIKYNEKGSISKFLPNGTENI